MYKKESKKAFIIDRSVSALEQMGFEFRQRESVSIANVWRERIPEFGSRAGQSSTPFFLVATVQHIYSSTPVFWTNTFIQRLLTTLKYVLVFYFNLLPGSLLAVKIAPVEM